MSNAQHIHPYLVKAPTLPPSNQQPYDRRMVNQLGDQLSSAHILHNNLGSGLRPTTGSAPIQGQVKSHSQGPRQQPIIQRGQSLTNVGAGSDQNMPKKKSVKDYHFGARIGEGSYSTVYSAVDKQQGRTYAIKVLSKRHIVKENKIKYVNIEKLTLHRLGQQHPGIVQLYYTFQDESSLFFVLDFAEYGELLSIIRKFGSLSEQVLKFYMCQIIDAVSFIHLKNIIHRDLKPENILVGHDFNLKITDFGAAKLLDDAPGDSTEEIDYRSFEGGNDAQVNPTTKTPDRLGSFVGTAEYVPPELLKLNICGFESDVWAVGCMLYQFFNGTPPFKGNTEYLTFEKIIQLDYSYKSDKPVPEDVKFIIDNILIENPSQRFTLPAIMSAKWFHGVNWTDKAYIWQRKVPKFESYAVSQSKPLQTNPFALKNGTNRKANKSSSYQQLQSQMYSSDLGFLPDLSPKKNYNAGTQNYPASKHNVMMEDRSKASLPIPQPMKTDGRVQPYAQQIPGGNPQVRQAAPSNTEYKVPGINPNSNSSATNYNTNYNANFNSNHNPNFSAGYNVSSNINSNLNTNINTKVNSNTKDIKTNANSNANLNVNTIGNTNTNFSNNATSHSNANSNAITNMGLSIQNIPQSNSVHSHTAQKSPGNILASVALQNQQSKKPNIPSSPKSQGNMPQATQVSQGRQGSRSQLPLSLQPRATASSTQQGASTPQLHPKYTVTNSSQQRPLVPNTISSSSSSASSSSQRKETPSNQHVGQRPSPSFTNSKSSVPPSSPRPSVPPSNARPSLSSLKSQTSASTITKNLSSNISTSASTRPVPQSAAAAAAFANKSRGQTKPLHPEIITIPKSYLIQFREISGLLNPNEKILKMDTLYMVRLEKSLVGLNYNTLDDMLLEKIIARNGDYLKKKATTVLTVITNMARIFFINNNLDAMLVDLKANKGKDCLMYDYEFEGGDDDDDDNDAEQEQVNSGNSLGKRKETSVEELGYLIIELVRENGDLIFLKQSQTPKSKQMAKELKVLDKHGNEVLIGADHGWIDCLLIARETSFSSEATSTSASSTSSTSSSTTLTTTSPTTTSGVPSRSNKPKVTNSKQTKYTSIVDKQTVSNPNDTRKDAAKRKVADTRSLRSKNSPNLSNSPSSFNANASKFASAAAAAVHHK